MKSQAACIVVLLALAATGLGCSAAKPIATADAHQLAFAAVQTVRGGGVLLKAAVLGEEQAGSLLGTSPTSRSVVPFLFAVTNEGKTSFALRREHFRLRIDNSREIEPTLPGRAATLLRDSSEQQIATLAGALVFGVLAAPSVHAAQLHEEAAVAGSRDRVFSTADIAPGATVSGFLFFESPLEVSDLQTLDLELVTQERNMNEAPIVAHFTNPYH